MFSLNLLVLTEKAVYSVPFNISRLKYIGMIQSDVFLHYHSHVKKLKPFDIDVCGRRVSIS